MSLTSAAGGGAVAPGWYTDPHDPRQFRWWSGEGWTEHVSAGASEPQAAEQAVGAPAQAAPAQPIQDAPLPSRRAHRDSVTEATDAAETALAAQAAQQRAQIAEQQARQQAAAQAQAQAQAQADQYAHANPAQQAVQQAAFGAQQAAPATQAQPVQPVQPQTTPSQYGAPVVAQQPSAPAPTLPVAPTSFLEQQGYIPLDGAPPADPNGWTQPAAPQAAPAQPQAYQPAQPVQPAQSLPPVETAQPNAWTQPVQPGQPETAQPNAWNQPVQPGQPETAQPNAWNQPVQPGQQDQQGWGAPAPSSDGIANLFGDPPAGQAAVQNPQGNQWGLTPSDTDAGVHGRTDEVAGSSSFWAWLIAISPILAGGSVAYVLLTTKAAFTDWPFEAAVAAPFLLVLLFALADRTVLLQLGHSQPRSAAWALLSAPVYLLARASETRREDGSGTVLTIVWFISVIVAVGGIVGYGFLTHHALIAGLPT